MEAFWRRWMRVTALMLVTQQLSMPTDARPGGLIGVSYGMTGNNLPSAADVINLYVRSGIDFVRIYEPNHEVLNACRGVNIGVCVGVKNQELESLSSSPEAASVWVKTHIIPFKEEVRFNWVTVGNEVVPGPYSDYLPHAITNIYDALSSAGMSGIKVTTTLPATALASSYPPSAGIFVGEATGVLTQVAAFLSRTGSPLMANVYPYFAYASEPADISLDYALFRATEPVVVDGEYSYYNLFDAQVDSFYAALEKLGFSNIAIAVGETGWPSAGNGGFTSVDYAREYNWNVWNHVEAAGTPRRPDIRMETFLFEMFNEDLKPTGVEQNFGFFYPNMQPVYPFW